MNHWVMDYETLINCFLGVFTHYKTDETKVFTVGKLRNDLPAFIDFLHDNILKNEWHISFNGLNFDAQITQHILKNERSFLKMSGDDVAKAIYRKAQDAIGRQNRRDFQEYPEHKLSIKQIDIFRLNHWDNPAKMSSLKWIQISMNWHHVQDMPISHDTYINTVEQLKQVASYCRNDVLSTKMIMEHSAKLISLRGELTRAYNINLYSASEPRISKELFLHFLHEKTHIEKYELKKMRTYRRQIVVKDIILPYLKHNDIDVVQDLIEKFSALVLDPMNLKGSIKLSINYKGVKTDFGLGGIHGAKKGIYEKSDGMIIMSSDVTSYYPNLAIRNGWAPAHLPKQAFCELYEWFFEERKKIPKSDPRNYVYKIVLNSTYGLSNDQYSFLYDPEFTMRITINGQLALLLLHTMLSEGIPGCVPIMQNTDGLEMVIPENKKEKYLEICKVWEELTSLNLEHDQYQKLVVADVNNYIGVNTYKEVPKERYMEIKQSDPQYLFKEEFGKYYYASTKCKGRFEFKDLALHKNKSFQIIPKAIYHFFVHDIPPETYLIQNRNIFDYCGGVKIRGSWKFIETSVKNGELSKIELQKTIRYYASVKGCKITKENIGDGRTINVISGRWMQTVFNEYKEKTWEEYDVDDRFYMDKIHKELRSMLPEVYNTQKSLF